MVTALAWFSTEAASTSEASEGRTTGDAARIGTGAVAPRASSRKVPPDTTITATPPRASAVRIATCRMRGICSGVLISSQYTLHSRNMGYVAATAALFALGAWLGRNLTGGVGILAFIAAFATLFGMRYAARPSVPATIGLLAAFGIMLIFIHIPGGALVYSVLGLVIFAGFTMFDFQRLRTSTDTDTAPLLAASIFLDVLNVFLFFLEIFSGGER